MWEGPEINDFWDPFEDLLKDRWQNMSNTRHLEFSHIALIEKKLYLEEL